MTITEPRKTSTQDTDVVEMSWDPVTRIVGSLGIYATIDFKQKEVRECHSTSSIFRGYSLFMKGKDPRDAHFITSRICGICGDNHATCSVYNQNMAYGVAPPHLGEWIINLGEAAEYMFDHNIFQENLVGVDYCERMVKETNPGVLDKANNTEAPHAAEHGYRTIGDIMRSLNPLEGEFYREALHVSRYTREMFCLMEGATSTPRTLYPGGVGTTPTIQLFTDYLTRLMRYVEFMKKVVPIHDDLFDFFYEALPGYEHVGERRILLGCWGSLNDPAHCDFSYENDVRLGQENVRHPGHRGRRQARHQRPGRHQPRDPHPARTFLLRGLGEVGPRGVRDQGPARQPRRQAAPVEPAHHPQAAGAGLRRHVQWTMSPRWFDGTDHLALDTAAARSRGSGRQRSPDSSTPWLRHGDRATVWDQPAEDGNEAGGDFEWKIPKWSNAIERNRARTYFQAYAAGLALYFCEKALEPRSAPGRRDLDQVRGARRGRQRRLHRGGPRGAEPPHGHQEREDRQLPPLSPTPWNGSVRDGFETPGPYEDAVQNTPIFEENPPEKFKGIDIMRAVRSFDPCLPCGVHMYTGGGNVVEQLPRTFDAGQAVLSVATGLRGNGARVVDHPERRRPRERTYVGAHGGRRPRARWARLSGVVPDAMRFCFEVASAGTPGRGCPSS